MSTHRNFTEPESNEIFSNLFRFVDHVSYQRYQLTSKSHEKIGSFWKVLKDRKDSLKEKLEIVKMHYRFLAPQGSMAWKKNRVLNYKKVPCVGGSEIAYILGANKHGNEFDLLKTKLGIDVGSDDINTRWGNLFEDALFSIVKVVTEAEEIFETGSIPGLRADGYIIQNYSPDGLGVVNTKKLRDAVKKYYQSIPLYVFDLQRKQEEVVVLFEGKSPLRRVVNPKEIPEHYEPQPKIGLTTIDIAEIGIFTEAVFRLCSVDDFDFNNEYHKDFHGNKITSIPEFLGVVWLVKTYPLPVKEIDYGCADVSDIDSVFARYAEDRFRAEPDAIKTVYSPVISDPGVETRVWFKNQLLRMKKKYTVVGYLPWKCFNFTFIPVQKDPEYGAKNLEKINNFHRLLRKIIQECKTAEEYEEYVTKLQEEKEKIELAKMETQGWCFEAFVNTFKLNGKLTL